MVYCRRINIKKIIWTWENKSTVAHSHTELGLTQLSQTFHLLSTHISNLHPKSYSESYGGVTNCAAFSVTSITFDCNQIVSKQ